MQIEQSHLCCGIHGVPTTPGGYADDLATATVSKVRTDKVHEIVTNYGKRWRFKFNAKKSAVQVYGETKVENTRNVPYREFKLGTDKVPEKETYDHVGVKACVFDNDDTRVTEKISKGRCTLNATTGLGIRKNGLSMAVCNIIFWAVVVPIITFGCEIWVMTDTDRQNLLAFQRFAGRRVQRLSYKSPNSTSYFGLGWTRLTTYIHVKKLLFVLTIIKLKVEHFCRIAFVLRLTSYLEKRPDSEHNKFRSPYYDLFNTCARYNLLDALCGMVYNTGRMYSKREWSKLCWSRAWESEDNYWESTSVLHKDSNLISLVLPVTRYLNWWHMADVNQSLMRMCENLVKIITRASKLKSDDPSLKGTLMSMRTCELCTLYNIEDIFHILMQCPHFEECRKRMYNHIYRVDAKLEETFREHPGEVFPWLLGKEIDGYEHDTMYMVWVISGNAINDMYTQVLSMRTGIG